ncbi:MAG: 4-(cytidine 5'-diphospho)-2-C-methyl-D-erythritol kinase [Bacteroidales bacterium]|nr:4-(cytidine 5'-diphospho)-2-C-methyl-D-erythritol kinase [Bacteroidales bacterium]
MTTEPNVKVNLGLNVLRKREDGYHDLDTLFVPYFGIHDVLEIIKGDDFSETSASLAKRYEHGTQIAQAISEDGKLMITIARKEGVDWDPLKDLTAKAYYLLDKEFGLGPVKIFLEKTSPVGAGLGGGSADAAFALKMLNELFGLGLSEEALAAYAAQLGSDCAFFIYNRPMLGEGRGEILNAYPLEDIDYGQDGAESCSYVLKVVVPEGIAVSTAEAYKGIVPAIPATDLRTLLKGDVESWKESLSNDFEVTVFKAHPELTAIKRSLYDCGAAYASMSGSGSALFGIYKK